MVFHLRLSYDAIVNLLWTGLGAALLLLAGEDPFVAARDRMVREQIEARGIRNPEVLRVLRVTPRHQFVPKALQSQAYQDHPLPIGYGATISQPAVVARMTELLQPAKTDRVLEIGTGSGYQAAVLSPLAAAVFTIEIVPELARAASARLARLGYTNVTLRQGDGYRGWPEKAPFDRIILTAAPAEVPGALLDQLRPGGRLVAPIGVSPFDQYLVLVEKDAHGEIHSRKVVAVAFVPMVHK